MPLNHEAFMKAALELAQSAAAMDEVPIGAVLVLNDKIVGRGQNRKENPPDPLGHAELSAITNAVSSLGRWRLTGCSLYTTLEPCLMCAAALGQARVDQVIFGASDPKGGGLGGLYNIQEIQGQNHYYEVIPGIMKKECSAILQDFFKNLRKC